MNEPLLALFAVICMFLCFVVGAWPDFKLRREHEQMRRKLFAIQCMAEGRGRFRITHVPDGE